MSIEKIEEFAESGEKHLNNLDVKQGFQQAEKPERQWFNYLLNDFSKKINQVIDGLSDIDFEFDGFAPKISELESNYTEISSELTRVSDDFKSADAVLQGQIDGIGGGKKAYTTYDKMIAAAALPVGDPLKLPANSSVDVTNDSDGSKNGSYAYDGTIFTKAAYDPMTLVRAVDGASTALVHMQFSYYAPYVEQTNTSPTSPLYIRLDAFYISRPLNISGVNYTWAQVKTDINNPSLFVTSPNGTPDCLALVNQSLVLNLTTLKFEVVGRSFAKTSEYVVIATGAFGNLVGGGMLDTWLNHRDYEVRDAFFYQDFGEQDWITAHVEQSKPPVNNLFHIRLLTIRIKTRKRVIAKTWAQVKADINNPALFVTSPSGIPDCLELSDKALVYNLKTEKFYIKAKPDNQGDGYNEIVLVGATYGQMTHGIVFDWWMNKRVTKLENSGGTPSPTPSNSVKPLTRPAPKFIAHGGLSGLHVFTPFNSITAIRAAGEYGFWGIETDLVETKDGEWVMIHDTFLSDYVYDATGNVIDYTLAELKAMRAGKPSQGGGWNDVQLMELRECLDACVKYNLVPFLEFKSVPTAAGIDKVVGYIKERMNLDNAVLTSFDRPTLTLIRSRHPKMPLLLTSLILTQDDINFAVALGNCKIGARKNTSRALVLAARAAGIEVAVWTVDQIEIDQKTLPVADYLITDIGIPHNFDKGTVALNFRSNLDYSNLTYEGGTKSVTGKTLTLPTGVAYLDVAVKWGDVVTVSFEGRAIGASVPNVKLEGYHNNGTKILTYTQANASSKDFDLISAAAINSSVAVTRIRVVIDASATGVGISDVRIRKIEV